MFITEYYCGGYFGWMAEGDRDFDVAMLSYEGVSRQVPAQVA